MTARPARPPRAGKRSPPGLAWLSAAALLLAGCGGDDERAAGTPTPTAVPASGVAITASTREAPGPGSYTARCADAACVRRWRAWASKAADDARACTEIYGGPERARVRGTIAGEPLDVTVTRSDGCGIADYERLFGLLGRDPPVAKRSP